MPQVVRKGDICTGHDCWFPRPNNKGSNSVFVNGIPIHRSTDTWVIHCCGSKSCHTGFTTTGSPTVFSDGLAVARKGDQISCGSRCNTHSPNVFADG